MDRKLETAAQTFIRAKLAADEANAALELASDKLRLVLPEGTKYVTKDGEIISHAMSTVRTTFVPERIKELVAPRIWKAIRIDAIDTKKLRGFISTGEVPLDSISSGIETTQVRSSLRVTWPSLKKG